jgi:Na+/proline symporter
MTPLAIGSLVLGYFLLLLLVAYWTGRKAQNADYFIGGHRSPWPLVAFGMIGASLSGVTFISVPGVVGNLSSPNQQFSYMQLVLGYLVGYAIIALILMPLYYRLRLTSIYTYLDQRFGPTSYRTGAWFFLLSRTLGSTFRIFLVTVVFQNFILDAMGVPYLVTIAVTLLLIWLYTYQGGIRTIVYTDTLQTAFMLASVAFTAWFVSGEMDLSLGQVFPAIREAGLGQWFFSDPAAPTFFGKQFLAGAAISTVMTGLDQDMMQKNNSCPNIRDAQKNMAVFSVVLVGVNLLFVTLGALLYLYVGQTGIAVPAKTDFLFPMLAFEHFPPMLGAVFVIGLIAAAFSSADSAITALTTSFCVDILGVEVDREAHHPSKVAARDLQAEAARETHIRNTRYTVHGGISLLILFLCYGFYTWSSGDVLGNIFQAAGFTYGPLLGLYGFGLFSNRPVRDRLTPLVCIGSVLVCLALAGQSIVGPLMGLDAAAIAAWKAAVTNALGGYQIGFEILIYNGMLTALGLWAISRNPHASPSTANKE